MLLTTYEGLPSNTKGQIQRSKTYSRETVYGSEETKLPLKRSRETVECVKGRFYVGTGHADTLINVCHFYYYLRMRLYFATSSLDTRTYQNLAVVQTGGLAWLGFVFPDRSNELHDRAHGSLLLLLHCVRACVRTMPFLSWL